MAKKQRSLGDQLIRMFKVGKGTEILCARRSVNVYIGIVMSDLGCICGFHLLVVL